MTGYACRVGLLGLSVAVAACGNSSPNAPTPVVGPTLVAPVGVSPDDQAQLATLRPTLVVRNGTSDRAGTHVYQFQVSDRSDFSTAAPASLRVSAVALNQTGVPEGTGGTTSYTPDFDLQPATRLFWRSRMLQGSTVSAWSATRTFNTPVAGYSRPGELYDPLVYGTTIGIPVGSTTFIAGRGLQINDSNSYVRYQLAQPMSSGEFSMEVEGLHTGGPGGKLKVFSMMDGMGDLYRSIYLLNAQYRGGGGNPDNSFSFKVLLGDPAFKLEPDFGSRKVALLDPGHTYFWRGIWSTGFRLIVQDGVGGPTLYDFTFPSADLANGICPCPYNPNPQFAYLGANNGSFGEEDGSWPGVIYRNVWVGSGPRPTSLGSALRR